MASSSQVKAGRAYVEIGVDSSALAKGLHAAAAKLKAFGAAVRQSGMKLMGWGSAVLAPMAATSKVFADMGSELVDASQRTGASEEALSALGFAAEQSGSDLATVESGLKKMQKTLFEAASGSQSATEALSLLNLSIADLDGLSPDQQFKKIADRLSQVQDPAIRAALAMQMFGKSGTQLLPLLSGGAKGIEELEAKAKELGLVMSTEDAQAAEAFGDTLSAVGKVLKRAVASIGSALVPVLTDLANWITRVTVSISTWLKENQAVVATVFKVAAVVVGVGAALAVLGTIISSVGTVLGVLGTIVTAVSAVFGALGVVIGAMLSPIGLVITAVVALGGYILYATGLGGKALDWLGQKFGGLWKDATAAWEGIGDALAAGDIGLAARILWLTLKMEWNKGVAYLQSIWLDFKLWFIKIAYGAFYGVKAAWEIVSHGLTVAWIETTAFLSKIWTNFSAGVQKVWDGVTGWVSDRFLDLQGLVDSSFDAEKAKQYNQQQSQANQNQIEQDRQAKVNQIEAEQAGKRKAESDQHEAELAKIGQDYNDSIAQSAAENAAKIKAAQDDITQAKAEWQAALDEAKRKRQEKEAADKGPDKLTGPQSLKSKLGNLGDLLNQASQRTVGVRGTFNAMEARGLAAGGVSDRLAKASEATAKNTKAILEEMRDGGAEFE